MIYEAMLENDYMEEILGDIVDIHVSDHHLLQYVVFKNYARILEHFGELHKAITFTSYALESDETDPSLWMDLARLAHRTRNDDLVYSSLESAFYTAHKSKYFKLKILTEICKVRNIFPCLLVASLPEQEH